jgi:hypothetical protein
MKHQCLSRETHFLSALERDDGEEDQTIWPWPRSATSLIDSGQMPTFEQLLASVAQVRKEYRDRILAARHPKRRKPWCFSPIEYGSSIDCCVWRIKHFIEVLVMSIATEILSLRRDQTSSVTTLLALLDWQHAAHNKLFAETRSYAVTQAADVVLLNIAVHALEARDNVPTRGIRRSIRSLWRKGRLSDTPQLSKGQRRSLARR